MGDLHTYGLIGKHLGHSFSKSFFTAYFEEQGRHNHRYELFEMESLEGFRNWLTSRPDIRGLNVTIPYKQAIIPFLDDCAPEAHRIGAVNVIRREENKLIGYNSDYFGFKTALLDALGLTENEAGGQGPALVLGTGGAARAVWAVLEDLHMSFEKVSRKDEDGCIKYRDLEDEPWKIKAFPLIVNTTPLGMYPHIHTAPEIPYQELTKNHFLFDLVYNPIETMFIRKGLEQGAGACNGLAMLHEQAVKAWDIWQS
jgi:shikimate dehydrogenase